MTGRKRAPAMLLAGGCVAALVACNVFASLDRCESDSDCPGSSTCDPDGRYCVPSVAEAEAAPPVDAADAADAADAFDAHEASPVRCDPADLFTSFSLVKGFENQPIVSARLTSDENTVIYSQLNGCDDESCYDFFVATRSDRASAFESKGTLDAVNCNMSSEYWPTLSADGLLIFFESGRALAPDGGACGNDRSRIWSATRPNTTAKFSEPRVDPTFFLDPSSVASSPYLHPNGLSLYFAAIGRPSVDGGGQDLYVATNDKNGFISTVTEVAATNTPGTETFPIITLDDTTLYFARGDGAREVWVSQRAMPSADFGSPRKVAELSGPADTIPAWISDDQCRLYFTSNRNPADAALLDYHLWVAERAPRAR